MPTEPGLGGLLNRQSSTESTRGSNHDDKDTSRSASTIDTLVSEASHRSVATISAAGLNQIKIKSCVALPGANFKC